MAIHFCALARLALSGPSGDVLADRWPHEFGAYCLSRSFDAWVSETMNGVKDAAAPGKRDKWTRWTIRDVDENVGASDIHASPVQTGASVLTEALEFRIRWLEPGDLVPIYSKITDGGDDAL